MGETGSVEGWPEELSRLDRHGSSGQRTPDTAGLQDLTETYRIPGVSIAVARLDGGMWCSGYGTTGTGRRNHVSPRTVFQACSISRHVTAFGALRLVAGSVLALDADIGSYLATWQLPADGG